MLSNDIKTMADSPVQGERFQLAHNYLKNYHRKLKHMGL